MNDFNIKDIGMVELDRFEIERVNGGGIWNKIGYMIGSFLVSNFHPGTVDNPYDHINDQNIPHL